jgi:hypothetical protein
LSSCVKSVTLWNQLSKVIFSWNDLQTALKTSFC